jgi:hypothetical protein
VNQYFLQQIKPYMKRILLAIVVAMAVQGASACDFCGMGVSNNDPFVFPHLHKRYAGINYLYRSYRVTGDDGLGSTECYQTWLLAAQFSLGKRVQLYVSLPLQSNNGEDYFSRQRRSGVGDASFSINYKILEKEKGLNSQVLTVGAGVKLPTGTNTAMKSAEEQNFQLGTGSFDYSFNTSYTFTHRSWMFGANASYKYNTANATGFRFGDIITNAVTVAYRYDATRFSVSPYLQLRQEWQLANADDHVLQSHTAGNAFYTSLGADASFNKISWGVAMQLAPVQQLAGGNVSVNPGVSTHISFIF